MIKRGSKQYQGMAQNIVYYIKKKKLQPSKRGECFKDKCAEVGRMLKRMREIAEQDFYRQVS